jgi:peptide/nickel transport system permease protein
MNSDYIKTARAKGLPEWKVNFKHGFRVSCTPIIVLLCQRLPILLGGSIITETLFQWPGMGTWFTSAVNTQNTPVIMCVSFFTILIVLITSLLMDILTAAMDPRVRLS